MSFCDHNLKKQIWKIVYENYRNSKIFSLKCYQFPSFIHPSPIWGFIRATFEYFGKRVPDWTEMQKIWSICFDEMHIETVADLDRRLDCVVGPASEANLIFVSSCNCGVLCYISYSTLIKMKPFSKLLMCTDFYQHLHTHIE